MNDERLLWNMSRCLMWDEPEYTKNERIKLSAFFKKFLPEHHLLAYLHLHFPYKLISVSFCTPTSLLKLILVGNNLAMTPHEHKESGLQGVGRKKADVMVETCF